MTMVVKRRLSPTMVETMSVATTTSSSASTSTTLHSESGHGDQILPLYSERVMVGGAQHHRLLLMTSSSVASGSIDDESDYGGDDLSSTCSSRMNTGRSPMMMMFTKSSSGGGGGGGNSVASEPCLPLWSRTARLNDTTHRYHGHGDAGPTRSTFVFTARKRKNPIYLIVGAFSLLGLMLYGQSHATLHDALQQVLRLTEERRQVHAKFDSVEQDIQQLRRQMMELVSSTSSTSSSSSRGGSAEFADEGTTPQLGGRVEERDTLQEKLREGSSQIGNLQKHLQDISKRDAIQKYGAGKIRVELELEFPGNSHSNLKEGPNTIIMEMAPLDMMPHSVYVFLEMVDAQLFDGCSFILNAMHVIKAAPLPYDGSSAAAKVRSFAARGLESVAFREYSPDFPHDQYSVGFAADDSPSFYINTQDNSDIHVGEPCFAKIISGFETVQRMEEAPTRNGIWYRQRIGIKRAYIL